MTTSSPTCRTVSQPPLQYRFGLVSWIKRNIQDLGMITHWCAARGQSLQDYQGHLSRGGLADRLKILLALIALDTPIMIVMADTVWITARSGIDFSLPTVVLTVNGGIPCHYVDPEVGNAADVDTSTNNATASSSSFEQIPEHICVPVSLLERPQGGRPLVKFAEYPGGKDNSTSLDTDPDEHLSVHISDPKDKPKSKPSGKASPQLCLVCSIRTTSKVTLVHHLCTEHQSSHLFPCANCDTHFNNAADLASHISNSHSKKKIICHHCDYTAVNKSRMCTHVHRHTTGLKYQSCDKGFPMK